MSCEDREKRQAEALKANLRRRKARAQAAGPPVAEIAPPAPTPDPADSEQTQNG